MIVLSRFRVTDDPGGFRDRAESAIAVLAGKPGFRSADLGRNLDEPALWTLTSRWTDVGSYRRAITAADARAVVVPLLSLAVDEPSAYEHPDLLGDNSARVVS